MRLVVTLERDETGMVVAECPAIPVEALIADEREHVRQWRNAGCPGLAHELGAVLARLLRLGL